MNKAAGGHQLGLWTSPATEPAVSHVSHKGFVCLAQLATPRKRGVAGGGGASSSGVFVGSGSQSRRFCPQKTLGDFWGHLCLSRLVVLLASRGWGQGGCSGPAEPRASSQSDPAAPPPSEVCPPSGLTAQAMQAPSGWSRAGSLLDPQTKEERTGGGTQASRTESTVITACRGFCCLLFVFLAENSLVRGGRGVPAHGPICILGAPKSRQGMGWCLPAHGAFRPARPPAQDPRPHRKERCMRVHTHPPSPPAPP